MTFVAVNADEVDDGDDDSICFGKTLIIKIAIKATTITPTTEALTITAIIQIYSFTHTYIKTLPHLHPVCTKDGMIPG